MNPATANNSSNYILTEPAKKPKSKKKPAPPPIRIALSASYNQATNQVTLKGPKKVKTSPALTLTVIGTGPNGIAKLDGLLLAGSGGHAGTNYVASVTGKAVSETSVVVGNTIQGAHGRPHPVPRPGGREAHGCSARAGLVPLGQGGIDASGRADGDGPDTRGPRHRDRNHPDGNASAVPPSVRPAAGDAFPSRRGIPEFITRSSR